MNELLKEIYPWELNLYIIAFRAGVECGLQFDAETKAKWEEMSNHDKFALLIEYALDQDDPRFRDDLKEAAKLSRMASKTETAGEGN